MDQTDLTFLLFDFNTYLFFYFFKSSLLCGLLAHCQLVNVNCIGNAQMTRISTSYLEKDLKVISILIPTFVLPFKSSQLNTGALCVSTASQT